MLDSVQARAYWPRTAWNAPGRFQPFNEEHMGSPLSGNAVAAMAVSALPQDIKINRDGFGRVSIGGGA